MLPILITLRKGRMDGGRGRKEGKKGGGDRGREINSNDNKSNVLEKEASLSFRGNTSLAELGTVLCWSHFDSIFSLVQRFHHVHW